MKQRDEMSSILKGDTHMFTPLREGLGQLNYSKIRRKVLEYFSKNNYELLEKELQNFSKNQLEDFFTKEGRILLKHAMNQSDSLALSFIFTKIPSAITKPILIESNFSVLKQFLGGQSMMEKCGQCDEKERDLRVEKFKILSNFDEENIKGFIETSEINSEHFLTPTIKEDLYSSLKTVTLKKY